MPRIRNTPDGPQPHATVIEEQRRRDRGLGHQLVAAPMPGDSTATLARLEAIRTEIVHKTGRTGLTTLKSGELQAYRDEIQRLRYEDWQNQRRTA